MKVASVVVGCSVLVAALVGANTSSIKESVNPAIKPVGLEAQDSHAAASLLGQFRTSASSWLFLHADLYLHNGVEMRPLTDAEIKNGRKGVGGDSKEEKIHDDSKIVTVIPSEKIDFRGIFGDIERATTSYKDMTGHSHNTPKDSLPLFRLMTFLDPQFVSGWTTGANIMLWEKDREGFRKALVYLNEGLQHNPKSIDILSQIAFCHLKEFEGKRDFAQALPFLQRASVIAHENWGHLSEDEIEASQTNYRRLAVTLRELGKKDEERRIVLEGLEHFPGDTPLAFMLRRLNGEVIPEDELSRPMIFKPKELQEDEKQKRVPIRFI
ncbi:MAG: tetratricopeptide repeat protein [Armatimonadota bacterium]